MSDIMERVQRGAALLDEKMPDWQKKIDRETLALASGCTCILGQVYGDYGYGSRVLFPEEFYQSDPLMDDTALELIAEEHGFYSRGGFRSYGELQMEWEVYLSQYQHQEEIAHG